MDSECGVVFFLNFEATLLVFSLSSPITGGGNITCLVLFIEDGDVAGPGFLLFLFNNLILQVAASLQLIHY